MKAPDYAYLKPATLSEAAASLARFGENASILAGGQSLMASLNFRLAAPEVLIDVNGLEQDAPELAQIVDAGSHIRIGMLVRHSDILSSDMIADHVPMATQAVAQIAHPAIRNRGTVCGSLAYGDPAAEWPAMAVALDARINLVSARGERQVPAVGFFTGLFESAREDDEIIQSIEIPKIATGQSHGFYEISRRHGDFALAGVCIVANGSAVREALKLVFFGVHSHACLANHVAGLLDGKPFDGQSLAGIDDSALAAALARDLQPFDDVHATASQRRHLAGVVFKRAATLLSGAGVNHG